MATRKSTLGLFLCLSVTAVAMGIYSTRAVEVSHIFRLLNMFFQSWPLLLLGFVLTAWATLFTSAKLRWNKNKAMLLPLVVEQNELGNSMEQGKCILFFGTDADETREETGSDVPQKPLANDYSLPALELDPVPFKDTSNRRAKTEKIGCFNMQGFFTNSRKK